MSENEQQKTRVFIISPEMIKKLGIASQITTIPPVEHFNKTNKNELIDQTTTSIRKKPNNNASQQCTSREKSLLTHSTKIVAQTPNKKPLDKPNEKKTNDVRKRNSREFEISHEPPSQDNPPTKRQSNRKRKLSRINYDNDFIIEINNKRQDKKSNRLKKKIVQNEPISKSDDEIKKISSEKIIKTYSRLKQSNNRDGINIEDNSKIIKDKRMKINEGDGNGNQECNSLEEKEISVQPQKEQQSNYEILSNKEQINEEQKKEDDNPVKLEPNETLELVNEKVDREIEHKLNEEQIRNNDNTNQEKEEIKTITNYTDENSENVQESCEENVIDNLPKRRPGRPRKIISTETSLEKTEIEQVENSKKRPGRPRKSIQLIESDKDEEEEIVKKFPKRKSKQLSESEQEDETNVKEKCKMVQCGVCKEELSSPAWSAHKLKHYNLCWKVGQPEIDLSDERLVTNILTNYAKGARGRTFACSKCGVKKKSVVGFMSHQDQCQKTKEEILAMRAPCTICGRLMQQSSLKVHMSTVHSDKENKKLSTQESSPSKSTPILNNNSPDGRTKRKAAVKAANLIQEVVHEEPEKLTRKESLQRSYKQASDNSKSIVSGALMRFYIIHLKKDSLIKCKIKACKFSTSDLNEMKEHLDKCPQLNPNDFVCRYCLLVTSTESAIMQHVKKKHMNDKKENDEESSFETVDDTDNSSEEDQSTDENVKEMPQKEEKNVKTVVKRVQYKINFLLKDATVQKRPFYCYESAFELTQKFCNDNYCEKLFQTCKCLLNDWILIKNLNDYLPEIRKSMCVQQCAIEKRMPHLQGEEHDWKQYELFETEYTDDVFTMYCGGPVLAVAWLPTPMHLITDQYLAVCTQRDFDATYKISERYSSKQLIQFWNFGPLENKFELKTPAKLEYCLAHEHGIIWSMEWCPSGCYDENEPENENEMRRLGLLAVACSDGLIVVYSICSPDKLNSSNNGSVYKAKEQYKLIILENQEKKLGNWDYQATKLTWTKGKGHRILAGGFSNGMVCLWDLANDSPLLKSVETNGTIVLKSYHTFQPHSASITGLILFPFDGGKRWLFTASWDRSNSFWDLNNTSQAVSERSKGLITDATSLCHWACAFISFDDVFGIGLSAACVQNVRDYHYKTCTALCTNSRVNSLSNNDWLNSVFQGSLAGELSAVFAGQLLVSCETYDKRRPKRMLFGFSELIEKDLEPAKRAEKCRKQKEKKPQVDLSDKDEKYILQYLMKKSNDSFEVEPSEYVEAQNKYGLVFCDFKLKSFKQLPKESIKIVRRSDRMREAPLELYPLMSINNVHCNPNLQAYLYVASGYQIGFVRINCIRFLNK